jgi:hypothetical protein
MTTVLTGEVRQSALLALGEGTLPTIPMLKMGVPIGATKWDLFALAGRMYNLKQTTIGTILAGSAADNAGIVLTAPTIRLTVPTGKTMFPYRFQMAGVPAATSVDHEIAVIASETDSYTSGGTALTPLNWRTDNPRATSMTNVYHAAGSAIVEAALTRVRALYQAIYPYAAAFATSYELEINKEVVWPDLIPIVGPASFLVFLSAKTAAVAAYFSLDWAEVDTVSV